MGFKLQKKKKKSTYKASNNSSTYSKSYDESMAVSPEASSSDELPVIKTAPKKKKKTTLSSVLASVLIVVALGVFVFSLLQILTIMGAYKEGRDEYAKIAQDAVTISDSGYLIVDYDNLLGVNSDFKGWIDVPGTDISYPIVYSAQDNDVYLRTTFEKKSNSSGSIFIDYRCEPTFMDPVTVIYGHHMKDGSMFNNVKFFTDKSYWEEHREVHIYTKNCIMIYDIFAAYTPHIDDDCFVFEPANADTEMFNSWINNAKSRSIYDTGITPTIADRTIMLSTCVSGGADTEDYRHVVMAVLRETVSNPTA